MDSYFSEIYGPRWTETLKSSLLKPSAKVYVSGVVSSSGELETSQTPSDGAYVLDRASLEPVYALGISSDQDFLDLCAAPGGKSLMALYLSRSKIRVRLNDSSKDRVGRLRAVLFDHLPEETVAQIRITCVQITSNFFLLLCNL